MSEIKNDDLSYDIVNEDSENKLEKERLILKYQSIILMLNGNQSSQPKTIKKKEILLTNCQYWAVNADEFNFEGKVNDSEKFTSDNERMFLAILNLLQNYIMK